MSNNERQFVEKIRKGYEEKNMSKIDELRKLDRSVKRPAEVFAYTFGTIGSLILGCGMCLAMPEVIDGYMHIGIPVGVIGIIMVSFNYLMYKSILGKRRRKASDRILRLSGEILGNV